MKVAVLGYGTVGKGVLSMIEKNNCFEKGPVLVRKGKAFMPFMKDNIEDISEDSSIDTVVECIGGVDTAFDYVSKCMKAGKNVVTSNKALVAAKGTELASMAEKYNCGFLFSASCGGAIPVLHNIEIAKKTDEIISCCGIINGTTNFILSGLEDGLFDSYSDALKKAQELGYAEADPTADVSGMDTMRKIMLICAVAFNRLPSEDYCCEGIENIDLYKGKKPVRLIGECGRNANGSVYAYTEPVILCENSSFKSVKSNFNQVIYSGQNCGKISLYGQGAGMYPTASAVLRDLSTLLEGKRTMLESSCVKDKADNGQKENRYYVVIDGREEEKTMSVRDMHMMAKEKRDAGCKVFFAREEENA